MKKLLTILILLMAVVTQGYAEVVYSGDAHNVGSWSAKQLKVADFPVLAKAQAGDVIAVTVANVENGARISLQKISYSGFSQSYDEYNCTTGTYYFVLNTTDAAEVATNGLNVSGEKYTFSKVELLYKKTLWTGTLNGEGNWEQSNSLDKSIFTGLSAGKLLGLTVSAINNNTDGWHSAVLRYNYDSNILDLSFSETGTKVKELTGGDVTQLKEEGKDINFVARYLCISEMCTYVENKYKVTITTPTNGTITVKNGDDDVNSGDYVFGNTSLTLIAAGTTGYVFDKWTSPTSLSSENASANLSVTEDVTIAADFKASKTLQTLSTGSKWIVANGGVTIGKAIFANVVAGDILKVAISDIADGATYTLKSASEGEETTNWSTLGNVTTGVGVFTYTFTAEDITKIQASGLFVTGNGYTCGDIKIETAATISSDATHSDPTLTITTPENGTISVKNGYDEVASGTKIGEKTSLTLKAEPTTGYEFVSWTSPASLASADAETTIEMSSGGMTIAASFMAVNEGTAEPEASTVTATDIFTTETALGNWEVSSVTMAATTFTNAIAGDYIKLTITPASTSCQFNLQTMDNSWSNLSDFTTVTTGKTATKYVCQITPNALTQLQATGLAIKGKDCTVNKVELLQQKHTLTVENTEGGNVTVSKGGATTDVRSFEKGASLTFTATPVTGAQFIKWQKDDTDLEETSTTLVTDMTGANMKIKAFFQGVKTLKQASQPMLGENLDTHVTVAKTAFTNATAGDILIINMSDVQDGATITLKENGEGSPASYNYITANYSEALTEGQTAYQVTLTSGILAKLQEQGLYITGEKFTCGNIALVTNGDVTTDAAHVTQYLLTITQPSEGGTIKIGDNDAASKAYTSGTEVSLTATPATNYKFVKWTKDSEDLTETTNPITLSVTANTSIAATFKQMHSVTAVSESDAKGTVAVTNAADDNLYDTGSTITVTATPKSGYEFEKWTKTENASWSSTNNPLNIEDLSADWTLTASFTDATFTAPEGETVLSSESTVVGNWGGTSIPTETYNTYKQGDVIKVYVKAVLENAKVAIQEQQGWTNITEESIDATTTVYSYTVTASENLAKMNSSGLKITGENYTIWGVTIIPAVIPVKNLSTGSTKINGSTSVVIHKEMFANASVGDVITINISSISTPSGKENPGYAIKGAGEDETENSGYNWKWIEGESLTTDATSIIRTITSDDLVTLKASGLSIEGDGIYVCGDVTLTTNGEVPEAQTHSNPSFTLTVNEPIGGTIAIKKDSETVSAGAFDIDTELTLTATAANGYTFLKWQKNGEDAGTDATLSITMSANTEITALFQGAPLEYEEKRTLFEGSVDINWSGVAIQPSTVGAILEAGEQLILTTTVAEGAYGQVVIRGADRSDAIEGSAIGGLVNGENVITLTSAMVEAMREEFGFWGADATLTKVVLYKPVTVFSEAGVADLTTMTEGEGKSTLAVPHNEALKGNVLVVESTEDATVTVTYTDNTTATNKAGNRKVGTPAASQALVLLDANKYIAKIEVNKAKSVISKIYTATLPVFEADGDNYAADLAMATADAGVLYDTSSFTIAVSSGWKGISLTSTEGETVKGAEISLTFGSEAKVKTTAYYTDGTDTGETGIMSEAATVQKLAIDNTKTIKSISIQPQEAGAVQLKEVKVNAEATPDPAPTPEQTGVNISLNDLNEGWSSSYNATTKTITTEGEWAARGWYIGDNRYNSKGSVTVKFEAVNFGVTLKMEYTNTGGESKSVSAGAAAGETGVELDIPADIKTMDKVYITYQPIGTLKLTEATVNDKVVDNRTEKTLVEKSQAISEGDIKINRGLFANAVVGDIIRIYGTPGEGAKIALEPSDYSGALDGANWAEFSTSPFELVLTDALLTTVKAKDLLIRGEKYTFTKAVLYSASAIGSTVYALKVTQPTAGGTIKIGETDASASQDIAAGESVTLTASPAEGYHLDYWTKDDTNAGTESTLTFTMEADVTVTASFSNKSERVLKEESIAISEGDIKINRGLFTNAVAGDIIRIYGTPESGAKIALEPADYSGALDGANWAEFSTSPFELVLTEALLTTVKAKNLLIRGEKYTFTKAVLYSASAIGSTVYALKVTQPTEGGTIKIGETDASASQDIAAGESVTLTASPAEGYHLDYWTKDDANAGTESTLTFAMESDVTVTASFSNKSERVLKEESIAISEGDIKINRGLFTNAVVGDIIRIYGTPESGAKIALEPSDYSGALDGANWAEFSTSPFELVLTDALLTTIKAKDLLIRGEKYTFTKAVLYTEKELGKEIIDVQKYTLTLSTPENGTVVIKKGNEKVKAGEFDENTELTLTATAAEGYEFTKWQKNGEDAGTEATLTVKMTADMTIAAVFSKKTEPIIDEETGETDLTEMTPQDPSTTTVEYNDEDQSITITTTEPYKAAQIWFNEPEKLAKGNVLIVDIAESGVNVTVTVKYTDGTESSMTSTAHAASSRHAAAAGTKISVPLETGKDVQNIEVKNAEAGTITIQKMVVTTKNIFTDGVADLSMAKPQSNAIYDTSTYSLAVTKGWTGITITPLATEQVSGVELMLQFTSAAQVKVAVTYNEGEGPSVIMDEAAKYLQMTLDKTKTVKEIQIQPTAAGVVQFKSLAVNQAVSPAPDYVAPLEEGERRTLFESMEGTQLSWNDICQMAANYGAILEEREQIEVYISARTEDCEWPKVFIKDANGEECGTVAELSAVDLFPYMAKFKLTNEMVEQLRDGFSICGDGIIVTQVCLYKPAALKAGDIDVADLNGGYQSSYDATSKTITTTSRWAARGWDIGDNRYNNYDVVVVQFEAVEFPVTLRMEYVDMNGETKTLSQGASAGNTQVEIEIPDDIQQINYVYLMYENPGTLILTNAEALRSTYRTKTLNLADFEAISDGTTYDNKTFTMTSTADNGTIQLWLNSPIEGGEDLTLTLVNDAAKVSMLVGYTDGSQVSVESEGTTALLPLNHSKNIQKIMISIQTAGTVQFESIQMTQRILTFIPSVKTDIHYQQNDDSWYRLDGKRVSQPGRGIYIHNGKKIVIK